MDAEGTHTTAMGPRKPQHDESKPSLPTTLSPPKSAGWVDKTEVSPWEE